MSEFPYALAGWSFMTALIGYRTLVRPSRAVLDGGVVTACPGPNCSKSMTIQSTRGSARVYALAPGVVVGAAAGSVSIASSLEPVVVTVTGPDLLSSVALGQRVKLGQAIAQASTVDLSVSALTRDGTTGAVTLVALEPATFLASHGLKPATHRGADSTGAWCDLGRHLVVPQAVAQCGIRLPDPPGFALLPVSAQVS